MVPGVGDQFGPNQAEPAEHWGSWYDVVAVEDGLVTAKFGAAGEFHVRGLAEDAAPRLPAFGGGGEAVMTDRVQFKGVEAEGEGVARPYALDAEWAGQEGVVRTGPGADPGSSTRLKTRGVREIVAVQIDGRRGDGVHHGTVGPSKRCHRRLSDRALAPLSAASELG